MPSRVTGYVNQVEQNPKLIGKRMLLGLVSVRWPYTMLDQEQASNARLDVYNGPVQLVAQAAPAFRPWGYHRLGDA